MTQDSSATQASSQTPIATIMSTSEAGKIEGGCFGALIHILKFTVDKFINEFKINQLKKTGHKVVQDSSATQVSSQTPLATIANTGEAGNIVGGCFCENASYFEFKETRINDLWT